MRIDAHHHFWNYNSIEYNWIDDEMKAIRRDFGPVDLQAEIAAAGINGVVSVQARQSLEETDWLLELTQQNDFIKGIVGWLPLASPDIEGVLQSYARHEKLVGVRHVVQGEPDDFLAREDFNRGIGELQKFDLVYDLLVTERQLPQAIAFVDKHPRQKFVLDHIAKPLIKEEKLEPWRTCILELARRDNVVCKLSGMVTEADYQNWTPQTLQPYFDVVLEAFGTSRLLFGSDWPVCTVASDYLRWMQTVEQWLSVLSSSEQEQILSLNAMRVYKLT